MPPIRLLGIQIANGFSPEARVYASLLAHRERDAVDPHTLFHAWPGSGDDAARFADAACAPVRSLDFGWRSVAADRSLGEKVGARVHFLAALPRALALARLWQPDVIYSCQQLWDCQAATYLARKLGKPQIIHLHYTIGPWLHTPVLRRLHTCAHVIAISDFIRGQALEHGVPADRVSTISNSVSLTPDCAPEARAAVRAELGLAPGTTLLGIFARVDPMKGQSDTLQALAGLAERHPRVHLVVAGSESPWHAGYTQTLQAEAARLGLGGRVSFLGRREDIPRLLAALDIFVHPSRCEPFGLAPAEAAAAGVPVVAYAEGATPELVVHEQTGLLAAPGDVAGLTAHLCRLLDQPALAAALGARGRARMAECFPPEAAGRAFTSLLQCWPRSA